MRTLFRFLLSLAAFACAQAGVAQTSPYATANRAVQIWQAREANAALMHQYQWNSRTEILSQGQVQDIRIDLVSYGPGGQLQRTLLNDQPAASGLMLPTPIGFLRRAVAEHKKKELQEYLFGLQALLEQYTLPTTGKILDFISGATPSGPDANGLFQLTGYNVVVPGDNLTLWVNPWTKHLRQMQVNTTFQGNAVQLSATFATLPASGLNYMSFGEATVPGKQLTVQVQNYDFARLGY
ncbi:MAG: hypothetical protein U1E63_15230 [Burkholderiales bacterium]